MKDIELKEAIGKTVAKIYEDGAIAAIAFTDGSYICLEADADYDAASIDYRNLDPTFQLNEHICLALGIDADGIAKRRQARLEQNRLDAERKDRRTYELLRRRFEGEQ